MKSSINILNAQYPEEEVYSPMFKPQPSPDNSMKIDAAFDDTKQANDGMLASPDSDFELRPQSTRAPWESALISSINYKNDSMVVRQKGALISRDMQLYANVSIEEPDQLLFDNIPAPEPYCSETSKLIKKIYSKNGNPVVERSYTAAKERETHRQTLEPKDKKPSKNKIIMNPKDIYFSLEKYSKSQRQYSNTYQKSLQETCAELGHNKPLQSKYCVDNYLYSQICPSGLATHKFLSVKAKKRLSLMHTQTLSSKNYPFSPRTALQLKDIQHKVNGPRERVLKCKSRKDAHFEEYFEAIIKDTKDKNFVKNFELFKAKKSKSYGSRREELEDVVEFMTKETTDVNTAHDIVMEILKQRKDNHKRVKVH